jgi:hypothetical protein
VQLLLAGRAPSGAERNRSSRGQQAAAAPGQRAALCTTWRTTHPRTASKWSPGPCTAAGERCQGSSVGAPVGLESTKVFAATSGRACHVLAGRPPADAHSWMGAASWLPTHQQSSQLVALAQADAAAAAVFRTCRGGAPAAARAAADVPAAWSATIPLTARAATKAPPRQVRGSGGGSPPMASACLRGRPHLQIASGCRAFCRAAPLTMLQSAMHGGLDGRRRLRHRCLAAPRRRGLARLPVVGAGASGENAGPGDLPLAGGQGHALSDSCQAMAQLWARAQQWLQ